NIKADKNQLDQVFTNIFINARDAMPSGGKLNILTQEVFVAERITNITNDIKTGKYVKISITDTGFGIPKEVSDRIFEPFFTTKENGTGLGLASVYGIIKNHDGHIYCESVESKGTTFTILLPASNGETTDEKIEAEISRGDSTILMVDDEEDVRSSVKNTLEGLGYTVLTAGDGNVAVEIYQREKENIDLILLDIVMPGKDGKEIYFELKKFNPDARVLLLSGYSQHGTAQELLNDGALGFIQKPFKIQELSETISEVMSEKDRE
ncbi:MAG: response regulator, partial [bacterium]|nr:response regulator [bacterium]